MSLAVALVSLLTAVVALLLPAGEGEGDGALRASALEAARERTVALTSYDHRSLDADVEAVRRTATESFKAEYEKTLEQLRPTLEKSKAVATSEVVAAGLESVSTAGGADRAVAVVAVDQSIATAGAAPRLERNRLRMTLVRPDETWLVEDVERL